MILRYVPHVSNMVQICRRKKVIDALFISKDVAMFSIFFCLLPWLLAIPSCCAMLVIP